MQTTQLFLAELIVFIVYQLSSISKRKIEVPYSKTIFIIPTTATVMMTVFQYTSLNLLSPSSYSIFKGSSVFTTLFFSKFLVNLKIKKIHIFSCTTAFVGLAIVGISDLAFNSSSNKVINFYIKE